MGASTHPRIEALQMKLMQERAEILARHPEYDTWAEYKVKEQAKVDGQYRIKAIQKKLMQARAEILARHPEYATWKEYLAKEQAKADKLQGQYRQRRRMPDRRMPGLSNNIKAIQEKLMQERATILAKHPEYDTWAEYKVKEQAKADKLKGQYHGRRRMPAASIMEKQRKIMEQRAANRARTYGGQLEASRNAPRRTPSPQTSSAIKAIQMKLQQERAAILAKYPEYETWAEYEADMTPDMIRH